MGEAVVVAVQATPSGRWRTLVAIANKVARGSLFVLFKQCETLE